MDSPLTAFFGYLVQILPGMALFGFLFRRRLRLSPTAAALGIGALVLVSGYAFATTAVLVASWMPDADGSQLRFCCFAFYMIIDYLCLIPFSEESLSRKLFYFGIMSNYSQILSTASMLIGAHLPSVNSGSYFTLSNAVVSLWLLVFTFPFVAYTLNSRYPELIDTIGDAIWGKLAFISVLYFAILSIAGLFLPKQNADLFSQIAMVGLILGAGILFVCIFMVLENARQEKDRELGERQARYLLDMQVQRSKNIQESVDRLRRSRHDLRHHFTTLASLADAGAPGTDAEKLARIRDYLSQYDQSMSQADFVPLCHNIVLDGVLNYYRMQALESGVAFTCSADIPEDCMLPDPLLSTIISNGLENALDAAKTAPEGQGWIRMGARTLDRQMVITIDNSFDGQVSLRQGRYLSTKSGGSGLGIENARNAAQAYGGHATFRHEGTTFHVAVNIPLEGPAH